MTEEEKKSTYIYINLADRSSIKLIYYMKYLALACGYQFILSYLKTWKSAYKKMNEM